MIMAIKKELRSDSCRKKKAFPKKEHAMRQINNAWHRSKRLTNNSLKRPIRAYHCPECDMWHMTSKARGLIEL